MLRSWLFRWWIRQTSDDKTVLLLGLYYLDYTLCIGSILRHCSLKTELILIYVTCKRRSKRNLAIARECENIERVVNASEMLSRAQSNRQTHDGSTPSSPPPAPCIYKGSDEDIILFYDFQMRIAMVPT